MKFILRCFCLVTFFLIFPSNIFAGETVPNWMRQAATVSLPSYDKEVPAAVLHNEKQVTLGTDGMLVTTENYAVRLLSREGRNYAVASALYLVSAGRVREIEGWLIYPNGGVKYYDKKSVLDMISDTDDIYNEYRVKIIDARDYADTGAIFGYTVVSEERPLYYQEKWFAQESRLPSLMSRFTLTLPNGWKASGITFNHAPIAPQTNSTSYTWELRNLPPIKREPLSPSIPNIVPWVAINYSSESSPQSSDKFFSTWTDVSRWTNTLYEPQVIVDDAVAIKAKELTANAKTEFEKIRAIAQFVQGLQYISIDIGVGSGNGYRPRPSNLVLARGYGDCKDKANLMRAMLKVFNIEAYPIAIFAGDPTFVREEWASPAQFNHCIIAVKISDSTDAPTVIKHAALGRLLIFDATDPDTVLGDLPDFLQGSFGLIIAGEKGGLTKMPLTLPEASLLERRVEVKLNESGEIRGTIKEKSIGQTSSFERGMLRSLSVGDYSKMLEVWLTQGATGARLEKFTPTDKKAESAFELDVEFSAPRYAQLMGGKLMIFKPVIVSGRKNLFLTDNNRQYPVLVSSYATKETAVFTLPQGFIVDELPDPVNLEMPFGKYSTTYEVKDGKLYFTRALILSRSTISVDKYNTVRDFFVKMREAEQSPVVLMKK
jgi:hypothetical protein